MNYFADPIVIEGSALFVSDAHLGVPSAKESLQREEWLAQLLSEKKDEIQHLFFLGDMFDFWFEYRDVVPKGYFRLFNILYELNRAGVKIYFFTGNHDMWVQNYFTQQFGCRVFYKLNAFIINGKRCIIGHGDGIGGKQYRYMFIKHTFAFKPNRWLYGKLPPRIAFSLARRFSRKSRQAHGPEEFIFREEEEYQVKFARQVLADEPVDCFIFGHRHIPIVYKMSEQSAFYNTGDWFENFTYLMFEKTSDSPSLHYFKQN